MTMIEEGQLTSSIYCLMRDKEYDEAANILQVQLQNFPRSRAALSLLGFCYYHTQDFVQAASTYERLVKVCPKEEYKIYHSQSLFRAGAMDEGIQSTRKINENESSHHINLLKAFIHFDEENRSACRKFLEKCLQDDPETLIAYASLSFIEGNYEEALEKYTDAFNMIGFQPDLAYNISLCHYKLKKTSDALDVISEVISRGSSSNIEFFSHSDKDEEIEFVNNSVALEKACLVEAYNLKAAIQFESKNVTSARVTLKDMPQRREEDLDPVSLHNDALMKTDSEVNLSLRKLSFLLSNPPFPPETFGNLLLLYCSHGVHDRAADILAENSHLTYDLLSQEIYDYLDASLMVTANPIEALKKFETISNGHVKNLRRLIKAVAEAKSAGNEQLISIAKTDLEVENDIFIPILMAHVKIYWDREEFLMVEKLLRKNSEYCSDKTTWKLNIGHTFFVQQGSKFKDSLNYYRPFVKENSKESILDVAAIVLANLCVALIMTNANEEAEDIMNMIEKEENKRIPNETDEPIYHSCIVNLVIGNLYCQKGNFDFGISRICKSLEPMENKLGPDTWFYTKTCLLALADKLSKQMFILKGTAYNNVLKLLSKIDEYGKDMSPLISNHNNEKEVGSSVKESISSEGRQLKHIFMKLME